MNSVHVLRGAFKDAITILISLAALGVSVTIAYFTVVRQTDELRVVFESVPSFDFSQDKRELYFRSSFAAIFINSGTRAAVITGVTVHWWETPKIPDDDELYRWRCDRSSGPRRGRLVTTKFAPIIIKAKEIKRVVFNYYEGWDGDKLLPRKDGVVVLPFPAWVGREKQYWAEPCISFQIVTPSNAYARGSVTISRPIGFDEKVNFYTDPWLDTQPYLIWKSARSIWN